MSLLTPMHSVRYRMRRSHTPHNPHQASSVVYRAWHITGRHQLCLTYDLQGGMHHCHNNQLHIHCRTPARFIYASTLGCRGNTLHTYPCITLGQGVGSCWLTTGSRSTDFQHLDIQRLDTRYSLAVLSEHCGR